MPREQEQFLEVVDRDVAEERWWRAIRPGRLEAEIVPLREALGRVLAEDVVSSVDVPAFDRSNVDGHAVLASETFGASEEAPRCLRLSDQEVTTGIVPRESLAPGMAIPIVTGAMLPRGADAVVMVEHTRTRGNDLLVERPVAPGSHISHAGSDIALGELVAHEGIPLTPRETGLLAAIGRGVVHVTRRPRVAILSTGDEIIAPGTAPRPGCVFDANATLLADAARELGAEPVPLGIVNDDEAEVGAALDRGLASADVVLLSGGTSKGAGDLCHRVLGRRAPGIVVHGVALKPGKPVCLGAVGSTPVAILPGFPTSAIFTFHEFVAPVIRRMLGTGVESTTSIPARMATRFNSERGRTEYLLVGLVPADDGLAAYPMGKGSGSVTTFSRADGFLVIPRQQEFVERGERVEVRPLGRSLRPADLVVIGSHCVGLDALLGQLARRGWTSKTLWVGSLGGLDAVARGECDLAGIHLLDPATDTYNTPFLPAGVRLLRGYGRLQGLVHRKGDVRFEGVTLEAAIEHAGADTDCLMISRNRGSGTRVIIDGLLKGRRPPGSSVEARSHNAVAAAVAQGRADWGVAIAPVAAGHGLGFLPIRPEQYDFAVSERHWDRPAVAAFRSLLEEPESRHRLEQLGFSPG